MAETTSEDDLEKRVRRYQRSATALIVFGAIAVAAGVILSGAGWLLSLVGVVVMVRGARMLRAMRGIVALRAATEANARSDHASLESTLRQVLARRPTLIVELSTLELLGSSLFRRGALTALDALLDEHLRDKRRGDDGVHAEALARLQALQLLSGALTGARREVDREAREIEAGGAVDGRALPRLMLARAVIAARTGDHAGVLRALDDFERRAHEASAHERALGRALLAMAQRSRFVESYRDAASTSVGGVMSQWMRTVFEAAAPFVEEPSLRAVDEAPWLAAPSAPPSAPTSERSGPLPYSVIQRWLWVGAVTFIVVGLFFFTNGTMLIGFALVLLSLMMSLATIVLSIARRVNYRRALRLLRLANVDRLTQHHAQARARLAVLELDREPLISTQAWLQHVALSILLGDLEAAQVALDRAFERLAWLPEGGRGTVEWANAVLWRPQVLAFLGKEREAEEALAFALRAVLELSAGRSLLFATRLWTSLAAGRREAARELARTFDVQTPIDGRTELARDALLVWDDPSLRHGVRSRVEHSLEARALIERVCPWLREAWEEPASGVHRERTEGPDGEISASEVVSEGTDDRGKAESLR